MFAQQNPLLLSSQENHVRTLTLNRPERHNALNDRLIALLRAQLAAAAEDPAVRVLVLTGAGARAFCAGADLTGAVGGAGTNGYAELLLAIHDFPQPTIAAVHGYCLAGGMGLMLACDIVIAHENAQFGTPEINVGLWPMMISALIREQMPAKQALPMMMLGERFSTTQALTWGLISQIADEKNYRNTVTKIAEDLAKKSPIVLRMGKTAYREAAGRPLPAALTYLQAQLAAVAATDDAQEGVQAFREKRPPRFTGG